MKIQIISLVFLFLLSASLFSQPPSPDTLWTLSLMNGVGVVAEDVSQTSDGCFIVAGSIQPVITQGESVYLSKFSSTGEQLWYQMYGGYSMGRAVLLTEDNGYIVVGSHFTSGTFWWNVYLLKTDTNGNQIWSRSFGEEYNDYGYDIEQTADGGYIIVGYTSYWPVVFPDSIILVKTDSLGHQQWIQRFNSDNTIGWNAKAVDLTEEGGYIITGNSIIEDDHDDILLLKTDSLGNQLWYHAFGNPFHDNGNDVISTEDGGYVIVGLSSWQACIIKTDALGNQQWFHDYGGVAGNEEGFSVLETDDGGYIFSGNTSSYGLGNNDVYIVKTDSIGNQQWFEAIGVSQDQVGYNISQTVDGGYIIGGKDGLITSYVENIYLIRLSYLSVTLSPAVSPIVIPAIGGSFFYTININNDDIAPVNLTFWNSAHLPNGAIISPILQREITLPAGGSIIRFISQYVPAVAPAGNYEFIGSIGPNINTMWIQDDFPFSKLGGE